MRLGEEHPETLSSMHSLAINYNKAGEKRKALQLVEWVVEANRRTLGEEHPDTFHSSRTLSLFQNFREYTATAFKCQNVYHWIPGDLQKTTKPSFHLTSE